MSEWALRPAVDLDRLRRFMEEIGSEAQGPGNVYLVGGATALLLGIREQTIDIDIKLDPEPKGIFESIAAIKERLMLNVELASPDMFLPALQGWRERSEFIARAGAVDFYHYDFYAQTLSKLLRGHSKDLADANALVRLGKVDPAQLWSLFQSISHELKRHPGIQAGPFESRVSKFVHDHQAT